MHLVIPKSFNDAQQVADKFKQSIPVVLNLQATDTDLAKRLIDFASGLTYALDGGMQRIAHKVFMLTPRNVQISRRGEGRAHRKGLLQPVLTAAPACRALLHTSTCSSGSSAQGTWPPRSRGAGATPCSSSTPTAPRAEALVAELGGEVVDSNARARAARRRAAAATSPRAWSASRARSAARRRASSRSSAASRSPRCAAPTAERRSCGMIPSVPVEVRQGVTCHARDPEADAALEAQALELFGRVGRRRPRRGARWTSRRG